MSTITMFATDLGLPVGLSNRRPASNAHQRPLGERRAATSSPVLGRGATGNLWVSFRPRPFAAANGRPAPGATVSLRSIAAPGAGQDLRISESQPVRRADAWLSRHAPRYAARANGAKPRLTTDAHARRPSLSRSGDARYAARTSPLSRGLRARYAARPPPPPTSSS